MRSSGVVPAEDPHDQIQLVHESADTRVTRLFLAGRRVVRKEPRGPDAERRLWHERAMLERVRGVQGVAQLLESPQYPGSIVSADAGDASLAELAKPLAVDVLLGLAVDLGRAGAGMDGRGGVHRGGRAADNRVSPRG